MALDDIALVSPPTIPSPTGLRFREAQLILEIPMIDSNGKQLQSVEYALSYNDPRLTANQRDQFVQAAKFIAKINGAIA